MRGGGGGRKEGGGETHRGYRFHQEQSISAMLIALFSATIKFPTELFKQLNQFSFFKKCWVNLSTKPCVVAPPEATGR